MTRQEAWQVSLLSICNLKSMTIPIAVEDIANGVFSSCTELRVFSRPGRLQYAIALPLTIARDKILNLRH